MLALGLFLFFIFCFHKLGDSMFFADNYKKKFPVQCVKEVCCDKCTCLLTENMSGQDLKRVWTLEFKQKQKAEFLPQCSEMDVRLFVLFVFFCNNPVLKWNSLNFDTSMVFLVPGSPCPLSELWDGSGGNAAARHWTLGFCIRLQFPRMWCAGHNAIKRPNCQVQFLNVHHPRPDSHIKDIH